jgi:hypothetical protein
VRHRRRPRIEYSRPPSSSRRWTRPYCRGPATPRKMRSSRITTGECARCSLAPIR